MARRPRSELLLALIAALLLILSPALAGSDAPFIVAHKQVSLTRLKSGAERVSVSIDVYNQGASTAYDVNLVDDTWTPDTFSLVSGTTSTTWERLDAGSTASHTFVLESAVKGIYHTSPAVIKFRIPTSPVLQEAFSTPLLPIDILAERSPEKKFEWAKRLLVKYGSLVSVLSFVSLFIYVVASPPKSTAVKGSKKRR